MIAIASQNGTVYLWDWQADTVLATLNGHQGAVRSLTFSPDNRTLLSEGDEGDNSIRRWGVGE